MLQHLGMGLEAFHKKHESILKAIAICINVTVPENFKENLTNFTKTAHDDTTREQFCL